jgi:hypothetical protein
MKYVNCRKDKGVSVSSGRRAISLVRDTQIPQRPSKQTANDPSEVRSVSLNDAVSR